MRTTHTRTATTSSVTPTTAPTRRTARATALTAIAPAVWGTTYIVTTQLLPTGHPLFASLVRALPAGLLVLAFTRRLPSGAWWGKAFALGTLNIGLFFPLLFLAAERLPGGVAATLGAVQPIIVAVLGAIVLGEHLSAWRVACGLVGVAGVGLITLGPAASLDPLGISAGLAGTASLAGGVILTKKWGRPQGVGPVTYTGWQLASGGLLLLPATLLVEGIPSGVDGLGVMGYLWLALFGGLISYTLWFNGIHALQVAAASLLGLLSPLVAVTLDTFVLGHLFTPLQGVGFTLTLLALVGGQITPRSRRAPSLVSAASTTLPRRPGTSLTEGFSAPVRNACAERH